MPGTARAVAVHTVVITTATHYYINLDMSKF